MVKKGIFGNSTNGIYREGFGQPGSDKLSLWQLAKLIPKYIEAVPVAQAQQALRVSVRFSSKTLCHHHT